MTALAFSPDGTTIVSAGDDGTLRIRHADTGAERATIEGHATGVNACAFSPDGRRIVSAGIDRALRLWDAQTGRCEATLEGHALGVTACAFSPDGRRLLSASNDNTVKLWDAGTGRCEITLEGHSDSVNACAFSPDGRSIVSAGSDGILRLWEASTGAALASLSGHTGGITSCDFSPDGEMIVSASNDNTVKLWDAGTGRCEITLEGHSDSVNACAFSPDGATIVSAGDDDVLRVWDAQSGAELAVLVGHSSRVTACAFSPDGQVIASVGSDGTLKLWDAATGLERICRELGDPAGLRRSLGSQANLLQARGDLDGAMALHREEERICRELGDRAGLSASLGNQAVILAERGDLDGAMALHREEERICRELGDRADLGRSLNSQDPIFRGRGEAAPEAAAPPAPSAPVDRVDFTVVSPPAVTPGESFVVDVWAHLREERDEVLERAREAFAGKSMATKAKAGLRIARGSDLVVTLAIGGFDIDKACDVIFWDGSMANADFIVSVPPNIALGMRAGSVTVTVEGLRLTQIGFMVDVAAVVGQQTPQSVLASGHASAFASYASDDRDLVLGRIQGMQKVAPLDVFLDAESLRSGQRWQDQLWQEIEDRDVFFLFWSRAAKASDWVEREWRCALKRRGLDFIDPVPLEPPDVALPPSELSELHFNDKWLAFMRMTGSAH